jgi:hypothetical protein
MRSKSDNKISQIEKEILVAFSPKMVFWETEKTLFNVFLKVISPLLAKEMFLWWNFFDNLLSLDTFFTFGAKIEAIY